MDVLPADVRSIIWKMAPLEVQQVCREAFEQVRPLVSISRTCFLYWRHASIGRFRRVSSRHRERAAYKWLALPSHYESFAFGNCPFFLFRVGRSLLMRMRRC